MAARFVTTGSAAGESMDDTLSPDKQRELEARLTEAAENGRVPCSVALQIAETLGIAPALVGRAADRMGIRFNQCQLGCF